MLAAILSLCGAMSVKAQKIEIVDMDGNAVPYASVMTADAALIGVTGMDGVIADIGGPKTVVISHVAYQPKTARVGADGLRVTLEDADFNLPEITVTKKDYTYLQQFERQHHIPALASEVLARMQELVDKD